MRSCLLCGVGGQGTVLASRLIAAAAMNRGLDARTAETIGMAQRGGCVTSHVRIGETPGETVTAPLIPQGTADVLIGFEPGEAARNLPYLKEGGVLIVCREEVKPVTASLGKSGYTGSDAIRYLKAAVPDCRVIEGSDICAECGSPKVLNVALMGALAESGAMGLFEEDILEALSMRLKPKLLPMNEKALRLGAEAARRRQSENRIEAARQRQPGD